MKRGTTPTLPVRLKINNADVASAIFLFKQEKSETAPAILTKTYPDDVNYDELRSVYCVEFTEDETWLFTEDKPFFMDTKITLTNGKIPETPIVTLRMHPTLFAEPSALDEVEDIAEESPSEYPIE